MQILSSRNLNLLPVLIAIEEERSLSLAAKRLKLTQPALSHALQKLRKEFGDPLFVRSSTGMTPTRRAAELIPQLRLILEPLADCYRPKYLNLKNLSARVTLASTTYFELRILKRLMRSLEDEAPKVRLDCLPLTGAIPVTELETGTIDVAVAAYFENIPRGMRLKVLSQEPHVCVVTRGHTYANAKNRLQAYLKAEHLLISIPMGVEQKIDLALKELGESRKVGARICNFMTPPLVLEGSDLVLTCPQSLAEQYLLHYDLEIVPTPIEVLPIQVKMIWHERTHSDPLQRWLRTQIERALG